MKKPSPAAALVTCCVGAIVLWRLAASGVQAYGADGAQYIEHFERLRVLMLARSGAAGPSLLWQADGSFPPGVHLVALAWGPVAGHSASAAAGLSFAWLLLLAGSVASVGSKLGGRPAIAWCAILLTPGLHGSATRYYYDLPMTALLWAGVALLLVEGRRGTLGAGLLGAAAALAKWAALPFGAPLFVAVAPRRALGAGLVVGALCAGFLLATGPQNSFLMMANATFAAEPVDWLASGRGLPGLMAGRFGERLMDAGWRGLAFYPVRGVISVLSPLLALGAVAALWRGRSSLRPLCPLAIAVLGGHGLFLLLVLPVWDERFLLPGVPLVALALSLALPSLDRRWALGLLAAGLLVLVDFHAGPRGPHNAAFEALGGTEFLPRSTARGLFAASSEERRGWSRFDEDLPERSAFREALWAAVLACGASRPTLLAERALVDASGDHLWFQVRALEEQLLRGAAAVEPESICMPNAPPGLHRVRPELDLLITSRADGLALPACAVPASWQAAAGVEDPEGGVGALLWVRPGSGLCSAL